MGEINILEVVENTLQRNIAETPISGKGGTIHGGNKSDPPGTNFLGETHAPGIIADIPISGISGETGNGGFISDPPIGN